MPIYRVEGVHRETGEARTFEILAENPTAAYAEVNGQGYVVAKGSEELFDDDGPDSHAEARARGEGFAPERPRPANRGKALEDAGTLLVFLGVFLLPLAVVGLLCGAVAVELTDGKRGRGVMTAGATVATLGVVVWLIVVIQVLKR